MDNVKVVYKPAHGYIRDMFTVLYYSTFTDSISEYYKKKNLGEVDARVEKSYRKLYRYIHSHYTHLRIFFMRSTSKDRLNINSLLEDFFSDSDMQIGDAVNYINRYSSYYLFYTIIDNMDCYNHFTHQFYDTLLEDDFLMCKYVYGLKLNTEAKDAIIDLYRHRDHIIGDLTIFLKEVYKRMLIEFDYLKSYRNQLDQYIRERIEKETKELMNNKGWMARIIRQGGYPPVNTCVISGSVFNMYAINFLRNNSTFILDLGYIYEKCTNKKAEIPVDWYRTLMPFGDDLRGKILKLIYENPKIGVSELARRLNRSPNSIEYQLKIFEQAGYLKKIWGECELDKSAINLAAYRMEQLAYELELKAQEGKAKYGINA